ncbi:hypothetical protein LOZ58_000438 [Ophidiomyces ophidiicola]|nr:hypothetical protein LOZ65_000243 [Ophidiomyces ophidiicola]KAI1966948.1 hypothetical protein LOZ58_000438 [Ophidiomyces ophidiicola]
MASINDITISSPCPGILHSYSGQLSAFEYGSGNEIPKPHSLLFVGGLYDGLGTVPYVSTIANALKSTQWSVFFLLLSSSYNGWGMSSLDQDVKEIGQCVNYVRRYKDRQCKNTPGLVVLMGHSTGSQDVLHYLYSLDSTGESKRPNVDGAILQAPVSDREHFLQLLKDGDTTSMPTFNELVNLAKKNVASGSNNTILPLDSTIKVGISIPISSYRFLSLFSPDSPDSPQDDDLFSSDLTDERLNKTFGMIRHRDLLKGSLMVLFSGADEFVPDSVDKGTLLARWENATKQGDVSRDIWSSISGIIPGALHSPPDGDDNCPQRDLVSRVETYLNSIEKP